MKPIYDLSVLLVDDDAMVRDVLVGYLKQMGLSNILEAQSSRQALEVIQNNQIPLGLVLSDWEMPRPNGLFLLKALRQNQKRKDTRFIMITSQQSEERFKIIQAGQWSVNAYLIKPFPSQVLREKIWQVMGWEDEEDPYGKAA